MLQQRKTLTNGILPSSSTNLEKTHSFQGGRRQPPHRNHVPTAAPDLTPTSYGHPYKRHHQNQSTSIAPHNHRRKQFNGDPDPTRQTYRRYDNSQVTVPEPDYSQTDTDPDDGSIRLRNPSFWANSSDYYHKGPGEDHGPSDANPSIAQKKRHSGLSHRWPAEGESIPNSANHHPDFAHKPQTVTSRNSRPTPNDHPHITTITLTDTAGSQGRSNGDPFGSSHRRGHDKTPVEHNRRSNNYRSDGEPGNQDIRSGPSPRIESLIPSSFSNVNLLKRVNDRYKLTERLLIQLKIIAVLHAFFGFAMFSLDSSQAIVLWPYVDDSNDRFYLCLRTFYSLGVVLIGCLSIAISCGKRSVLLEIVKLLCVVFLTTLLTAPAQTPFFKSIADSLQYNDALRRHQGLTLALGEQSERRRFIDTQETPLSVSNILGFNPETPTSQNPNWKEHKTGLRHRSATNDPDSRENNHVEGKSSPPSPTPSSSENQKSGIELPNLQKGDQRRLRAFRIAQHIRIAYAIFVCCHYLVTIGTLAVVIRLERLS